MAYRCEADAMELAAWEAALDYDRCFDCPAGFENEADYAAYLANNADTGEDLADYDEEFPPAAIPGPAPDYDEADLPF